MPLQKSIRRGCRDRQWAPFRIDSCSLRRLGGGRLCSCITNGTAELGPLPNADLAHNRSPHEVHVRGQSQNAPVRGQLAIVHEQGHYPPWPERNGVAGSFFGIRASGCDWWCSRALQGVRDSGQVGMTGPGGGSGRRPGRGEHLLGKLPWESELVSWIWKDPLDGAYRRGAIAVAHAMHPARTKHLR